MRNLLIAPVGFEGIHSNWLHPARQYEVCLIAYEKNVPFLEFADRYFLMEGFKYNLIHKLISNEHIKIKNYDYIFMPDPDIFITTKQINVLFAIMEYYDLWLAQPSLMPYNFSHPETCTQEKSFLRFTNYAEVMMPCFSQKALQICYESFIENKSSWGMDILWNHLLGYPEDRIAIIDEISVYHSKKIDLENGEFYKAIGTNPFIDTHIILDKYKIEYPNIKEFKRISKEL
jgi:hypothetical protein